MNLDTLITHRPQWLCFAVLLLLPVAGNAGSQSDMIELCRQTVVDYAYYRDRPDADGVAELFVESGVFKLGTDVFKGREAIRARIKAAQEGPLFRHMMSTIKIIPTSDQAATGVSYAAVYSASGDERPAPVSNFLALGEYHDRFVRVGQRCKIQEREFRTVMVPTEG